MAWIDNKSAFDTVLHKWILKIQNILKIIWILTTILKYSIERQHTILRLIHQKCVLKTNNLNINNGIFQGDLLSPLLFCTELILLSIELKHTKYGNKTTKK